MYKLIIQLEYTKEVLESQIPFTLMLCLLATSIDNLFPSLCKIAITEHKLKLIFTTQVLL